MRYARHAPVALWLAVFARVAAGQTPATGDAKTAFENATAAYEAGLFSVAAREFAHAYELHPHAAAVFNEARALERSGDSAQAADAYLLALGRAELRPSDAAEARGRLAILEQSLGRFELGGGAELHASIGHLADVSLPVKTHLAPGRYELEVRRADGKRVTLSVPIISGTLTRRELTSDGPLWDPAVPPTPTAATAPSASPFARSAYLFGGAALIAGTGIVLGLQALQARAEFNASQQTDAASHDRAVTLRTWANVALGAGIGLGATGLFMTWHDSSRARRAANNTQLGVVSLGSGVGVAFAHAF